MRHGSRKRSPLPVVIGALVVVVIAALAVYWFVIRDDSDTNADGGQGTPSGQLAPQHFALDGVPFTFTYPGNFALGTPATGIRWIAGISPVDVLDVKQVSEKALHGSALEHFVRQALGKQSGISIVGDVQNRQAGGVPVTVFTIDNNTSGSQLRSQLNFLAAGGQTWQLECQSQASGRSEIDAACSRMLNTLALR